MAPRRRTAPSPAQVETVRAFNRFYTNVIGVLHEGLLETPYSLTEARVIFELAQQEGTEVADLRHRIDIDAGYLSRILARFSGDGLVLREQSRGDARRQVARLTGAGRAAYEMLNARAAAEVEDMLRRLTAEDRRRLVGAMQLIRRTLAGPAPTRRYRLRGLRSGDLGWVVQRHGALYAEEYGWDVTFEALVARIAADYIDGLDARRENAWIAEMDGEPVGCVFCVRRDDKVAQLRLLLVEPRARGIGIGSRLVGTCLRHARGAGYEHLMLWTNDVLTDARRLYERAGFELREEAPHHSFGHQLMSQTWWRAL